MPQQQQQTKLKPIVPMPVGSASSTKKKKGKKRMIKNPTYNQVQRSIDKARGY